MAATQRSKDVRGKSRFTNVHGQGRQVSWHRVQPAQPDVSALRHMELIWCLHWHMCSDLPAKEARNLTADAAVVQSAQYNVLHGILLLHLSSDFIDQPAGLLGADRGCACPDMWHGRAPV